MSGPDISLLSEVERFIYNCNADGRMADLKTIGGGAINADFVRMLLRYCHNGVNIRNAHIHGTLNVTDQSQPGGVGFPALVLEHCIIDEPIDISYTKIARLSLRGSKLTYLKASHVEIRGPVDLREIAPVVDKREAGTLCCIDLTGARIFGTVDCSKAQLFAPRLREDVSNVRKRYGLRLQSAIIDGSVILNECRARGGISFQGADIRGDIWAWKTRLLAREGFAFNAQSARISGTASFYQYVAIGETRLFAAYIGTVEMVTARFIARAGPDDTFNSINASDLEIKRSLAVNEARSTGPWLLDGATIGGHIEVFNSSFQKSIKEQAESAVSAMGAIVGGSLNLENCKVAGATQLAFIRVAGNVTFTDCRVLSTLSPPVATTGGLLPPDKTELAIVLDGSHISGRVLFYSVIVYGELSLVRADIRMDVTFQQTEITNQSRRGKRAALRASSARVSGDLVLGTFFRAYGEVLMDNCTIGGRLEIRKDTTITNGRFNALTLTRSNVEGDVSFNSCSVQGNVKLNRMTVNGSLSWNIFQIVRSLDVGGQLLYLDLSYTEIANVLYARRLNPWDDAFIMINLAGTHAKTLDDDVFSGWGQAGAINFDGFTYDRLTTFPRSSVSWLPNRFKTVAPTVHSFLQSSIRILDPYPAEHNVHDVSLRVAKTVQLLPKFLSAASKKMRHRLSRPVVGSSSTNLERADNFGFGLEDDTHPSAIVVPRLLWIARQAAYQDENTKINSLSPKTYRQLARVYRLHGFEDASRLIAIAERRAMPRSRHIGKAVENRFRSIFDLGFEFGFSPGRATLTLLLAWLVGWLMVSVANQSGEMVVSKTNSAGLAVSQTDRCGSAIVDSLYAIDLMIPIVRLGQQERCALQADSSTLSKFWQVIFAIFALCGKVITSLAILTYSGVLKRQDSN